MFPKFAKIPFNLQCFSPKNSRRTSLKYVFISVRNLYFDSSLVSFIHSLRGKYSVRKQSYFTKLTHSQPTPAWEWKILWKKKKALITIFVNYLMSANEHAVYSISCPALISWNETKRNTTHPGRKYIYISELRYHFYKDEISLFLPTFTNNKSQRWSKLSPSVGFLLLLFTRKVALLLLLSASKYDFCEKRRVLVNANTRGFLI